MAESLRPLAESKGIEFATALPDKNLVLTTDARALRQILLNLVNNAIKFTEKGSVRLTLGTKEANGSKLVVFEVSDTGVGIRHEDQRQLFQAFSQLDGKERRRRHDGTGLGLHLSQKLAELLGGEIECRSEFGRGSTFTLAFGKAKR